jgi:hypothetical protein
MFNYIRGVDIYIIKYVARYGVEQKVPSDVAYRLLN